MTQFETLQADWLSVEEAATRVLAAAPPLETEAVPLLESPGRCLARDLSATVTLPPWDNSAMDGYAVRARDIQEATSSHPVVLAVQGEIRAGVAPRDPLVAGTAMRIMTGAPVPPGADAIVRVEDTDAEKTPGRVRIHASSAPGKDIRPKGQDMLEGDLLLERGTTMGPGQIGLAAATGATDLEVFHRPRVGILSNGDEIAPSGEFRRVQAGEAIPETNSPTLAAGVRGAGGVPLSLGIARDTPESILQKLGEAREAGVEVLVTSGGASMGELDLFKRVLDREGFRLDFWRVKMRPGTPFSFGALPSGKDGPPIFVFGLPGNPASSFVTFQIFCRPFLLRMGGHRRVHRPVVSARAGQAFRSREHLTQFFRVILSGDPPFPVATTTGSQTSGLVRGQGLAQGLGVVPAGVEEIPEGDPIRVILLDDFGHGEEQPGYLAP